MLVETRGSLYNQTKSVVHQDVSSSEGEEIKMKERKDIGTEVDLSLVETLYSDWLKSIFSILRIGSRSKFHYWGH